MRKIVTTASLLGLAAIAGCVQTGKNMHTQRALEECRDEFGDDQRTCETQVRNERFERDQKDKWKQTKQDIK